MEKSHTSKFWAGGYREFHRASRERNLGKGKIGLFNRLMRRIIEFLFLPFKEQSYDEKLFVKKEEKTETKSR